MDSGADAGTRPRIRASQALTDAYMRALCRLPDAVEIVEWDSRPFETPRLAADLRITPEGLRLLAIRAVVLDVLGQHPGDQDCASLRRWVDSQLDVEQVRAQIAASPEGQRAGAVRRIFREVLRRDPIGWDNATLRYWVGSPFTLSEIEVRLAAQRPRIGVHYFMWYALDQSRWGNDATAVGPDVERPILGRYRSADPLAIDTHLGQMADAGFDFVVVHINPETPGSWNTLDTFFRRLAGRRLHAAVMLDGLYTRPDSVKAMWVAKVKSEFAGHPNYFLFHAQPLVMVFSAAIDFAVPGVVLRNVYWTDSYGPGTNTFNTDSMLYPHDWPFWAPTPQPVVNGVVPVVPGYVDTHLGRERPMEHPRNGGRLYHDQWQRAIAQHPELIIVYSWNEYFERTAIEPTNAWGNQYLQWTACYTRYVRTRPTTSVEACGGT